MTTTSPPSARPGPRIRLSTLEWKLYLTAALSGIYAAAWMSFAARAPESARENARVDPTVWITDLAVGDRPAVSLPPGWTIAGATGAREPTLVRRAATTNRRIRTRTS